MSATPDPIHAAIAAEIGAFPPPDVPLRSHFRERTLRRGEYWLREGEVCRKIGFLLGGTLRLYVDNNGNSQTRWAFFPNTFFTSLQSFQQQIAADENIVAIEAVKLLEIDRELWHSLYEQHAFLRQFWKRNMDKLAACYEDRVNSLLLPSAKGRYRYTLQRYPDFVLRLPNKYVAEMLNMAPRHLSRVRREIAAEGQGGI